jgi:hypothetical protein
MSDNVVGLRGAFQPETGESNPVLIQELEGLLQAARSGELIGMAGSYLHRHRMISYSYVGPIAGYGIIGGLECVKERILRTVIAHD